MSGSKTSKNNCHAKRCPVQCSPEEFMCPTHWSMVPLGIQARFREHYRSGQRPTKAFLAAGMAAIEAVAKEESAMGSRLSRLLEKTKIAQEREKISKDIARALKA